MAFWGTEVKPGKPFTHKFDEVKGRLHLSMATLGLGTATTKSILQCNVGNKSPVYLCSLYPVNAESLQLNLEFEEGVDVIFSVLGPRSVHLSGYYMSGGRQELEPYGEDIADTETERSEESDEDSYEDSFIDDADPGVRPPSPISCDGGDILYNEKPKKNGKDSRRRLRKTYQMSESDDEECSQQNKIVNGSTRELVLQSEDEDSFPISSLCNSKSTTKKTTEKIEGKADKGTGETNEKKTEDDGNYFIQPKRKADEVVIDDQPKRQSDLPIYSVLPSSEVGSENGAKPKKKRKERSKENKPLKADNANHSNVLKEDKAPIHEARADIMGQDLCLSNGQEWKDANDKGAELPDNLLLPSAEVSPEDGERPKKKRKERAKEGENSKAESKHTNVVKEDKSQQNKSKADSNKGTEPLDSLLLPPAEVGPEDGEKPKKKRKERLKEGKTSESDSKGSNAIKEDKAQHDEVKADKDKTANDKEAELPENFSLPSTEVGVEDGAKPKKKSKEWGRVVKTSKSDSKHSNVVEEDRALENETKADNMDQDLPIRDEQDQNPVNDKSLNKDAHEFADENHSEDKKVEKKKKKRKTQEIEDKKPGSKVAASGEKRGTREREAEKERKRGKKKEADKERKRGEEDSNPS